MKTLILTALMTSASSAHARDWKITADSHTIGTPQDSTLDLIDSSGRLPAAGLTVGLGLNERMSAIVGFHTGTIGTVLYSPSAVNHEDEYQDDWGHYDESFQIALRSHHLSAGTQWKWEVNPRLKPTATTKVMVSHNKLSMDENVELEGSEVAVQYTSISPGLSAAVGIEYSTFQVKRAHIIVGADLGYSYYFPMNFKDRDSADEPIDIGSINVNGLFAQISVGTRF